MKFDDHWTYRSCYKPIDIKPSSGHLLVMVKLCVYQRVKKLRGQHLAYQQVKALNKDVRILKTNYLIGHHTRSACKSESILDKS